MSNGSKKRGRRDVLEIKKRVLVDRRLLPSGKELRSFCYISKELGMRRRNALMEIVCSFSIVKKGKLHPRALVNSVESSGPERAHEAPRRSMAAC
jgi:hypothetical protein